MKKVIFVSVIISVFLVSLISIYNMYMLQAFKKQTRKDVLNLSERLDILKTKVDFQEKFGKSFWQKTMPTLKKDEEELFEKYKKEVFRNLESDIAGIVPGSPILGGRWLTTKIEFITPDIILVHYEDGHISGLMIVRAIKTEKGYSWGVLSNEFIE